MSGWHRIRLRAAWDTEAGGAAWTRFFGRPTGIAAGDRVWLVIERPTPCVALLNGRRLPTVNAGNAAWRHDVTADLRQRNELRLEFPGPTAASIAAGRAPLPEALGAVALEIETVA